ncbi:MAG: hypothetical protein ABWK01_03140 [Infirmifilum sp.]
MDETVLVLFDVVVSVSVLGYWLVFYNVPTVNNVALLRDVCYLLVSPNSTTLTAEYALDVYVSNGTLVSATPITRMCLSRINETVLAGSIRVRKAQEIKGRITLTLVKKDGVVWIVFPGES